MTSRGRQWRAPAGLLGIALVALVALAVLNAEVEPPGGGCFGSPTWFKWALAGLAPLSVVAASASAGTSGLRLRWTLPACMAFAVSTGVAWLLVLWLTLVATQGPC